MERLENIVGKVTATAVILGTLYLSTGYVFGYPEARAQIVEAVKTVMSAVPRGNTMGAEIVSGEIEPSVQEWLDYNPHEKSYDSQ